MEMNFYSTGHEMSASSCYWRAGTPSCFPYDTLAFGFPAVGLRLYNSCGDKLWYSLAGLPSTTADFLAGCSAMILDHIPPAGGISLMSTSSSCTARPLVGVSAWASA